MTDSVRWALWTLGVVGAMVITWVYICWRIRASTPADVAEVEKLIGGKKDEQES